MKVLIMNIIFLIIALCSLILCAIFYNLYLETDKYVTLFHIIIIITLFINIFSFSMWVFNLFPLRGV